jgi:uncharacterized protein (UPF0218 family)
LILPFDKRKDLKKPLGELFKGEPEKTIKKLRKLLCHQKPIIFACVGDFVTINILNAGLNPNIAIIDNRIMRQEVEPLEFKRETVYVKNSPGTISIESQRVLKDAVMLNKKLGVVVEGEEDLLVLPLMAMMPTGSVIVYGQPREGMVVVTLTEERRRWAKDFMTMMEEN